MNNQPLISIIITAYNVKPYIGEALQSIINQSYRNLEIIVVDDCSTDKTNNIIESFAREDKRIITYRLSKNSGPSTASNFALSKAQGEYIARMDADDVAYLDRIEKQVRFLQHNPEVVMLGGQCDIINEQGTLIGRKKYPLTHKGIYKALFMINPLPHPGCMFKPGIFKKAGIHYEKKYFISHDLKILFKLLPYGTFANLPDTVLRYRYRPNSITHLNPKRTFAETVDIRSWALKNKIYTPSFQGLLFHWLEVCLVKILPNSLINRLFQLWRIKKIMTVKRATQLSLRLTYRFSSYIFSSLTYILLPRQFK